MDPIRLDDLLEFVDLPSLVNFTNNRGKQEKYTDLEARERRFNLFPNKTRVLDFLGLSDKSYTVITRNLGKLKALDGYASSFCCFGCEDHVETVGSFNSEFGETSEGYFYHAVMVQGSNKNEKQIILARLDGKGVEIYKHNLTRNKRKRDWDISQQRVA